MNHVESLIQSPPLSSRTWRMPKLVYLLLAVQLGLMVWLSYCQSPVTIEVSELPAGQYHLLTGRFNVAVVNPPLVRCIAAVPLLWSNPSHYFGAEKLPPDSRPERIIGQRFLKLNDRDSFWWFMLARWFCLPFATLGGLICARWAGELYGSDSAILAVFCWVSSPWILGHGGLITTDVPAAAMGLSTAYLFWKGVGSGSVENSVAVGVVLGFALLTKFTLLILPLVFILWWVLVHLVSRIERGGWIGPLRYITTILLVSLLVINVGYGFEGSFRRLGDFSFISTFLGGEHRPEGQIYGNRFSSGVLGSISIPLPENYVCGIDVQRRDFERGLDSFAAGIWSQHGWWWYYLYATIVKTPLGMLCLCIWTASRIRLLWRDSAGSRFVLALLLVFFSFVSLQTGFSVHGRYIIPALPYFFVLSSSVLQNCGKPAVWRTRIAAICCLLSATEVACVYPHCVSFFNVLAGGPERGYRHLVDSNISWGQDLIFLAEWLDRHPEVNDLKLMHFGNVNPRIAGVKFRLPSEQDVLIDASTGRPQLLPGWYAIDVNYLAGSVFPPMNENGMRDFSVTQLFAWSTLAEVPPISRAGHTILIFNVLPAQVSAERAAAEVHIPHQ